VEELSLHVLDLMENCLEAGASRIDLEIIEDSARNRLTIRVRDDGRGVDEETLKRMDDPFFTTRTTRHIGLGIPLFKAAARQCNGDLVVTSQPGVGTEVLVEFERDHIDRAPLGDIKSTLLSVILSQRRCDLHYVHRVDNRVFEFDTEEMRRALGGIPLGHPRVRAWLEDFLAAGYVGLYGSRFDWMTCGDCANRFRRTSPPAPRPAPP